VELGPTGALPEITALLDAGYDGWIVDDFDYSGYPAANHRKPAFP
jgi:hypothetical protein